MSFHDINDSDIADLLALVDAKPNQALEVKLAEAPIQEPEDSIETLLDEVAVVESIVAEESSLIESALDEIQAEAVKQEVYSNQSKAAKKSKPAAPVPSVKVGDFPDAQAFQEWVDAQQLAKKPRKKRVSKPKTAPAAPNINVQDALSGGIEAALNDLGMDLGQPHPFTDEPVTDQARFDITSIKNQKQLKAIVNALAWKIGRDGLYVYTRYAIEALKADKGISKKVLEQHYLDAANRSGTKTLAQSTAKSQAEKYWHVLPALGLARIEGDVMVPEPCSLSLVL